MPGVASAGGKAGTGEPAPLWERGRGREVFPSERLVQLWAGAGVLWRSLSGEILLAATAVGPRAGNQLPAYGPCCPAQLAVMWARLLSRDCFRSMTCGVGGYWDTGKKVVLHGGWRRAASCSERVRELFDLCQSRKVCSLFQKIGRQISVGKWMIVPGMVPFGFVCSRTVRELFADRQPWKAVEGSFQPLQDILMIDRTFGKP